ncbi:hypothetical protein L484_016381 [Morus notabilis]|uniref:Retrovirus-related Pol polyprotein from transposon TNT 1-94 n=1 Tax=Morus notabilis TaxID=981085 RepID=W9RW53_9ROSA|nr:hypothetical protein L484_016381 [Morus notabilis]
MESISDALAVTGHEVSDDDIITMILARLPSEYDVTVGLADAPLQSSEMSLHKVEATVLTQECRIEQQNNMISSEPPTQNNNNNNQQQYGKPAAFFAGPATVVDPAWYADTGATNHVTAELENLQIHEDRSVPTNEVPSASLPAYRSTDTSVSQSLLQTNTFLSYDVLPDLPPIVPSDISIETSTLVPTGLPENISTETSTPVPPIYLRHQFLNF